MKRIEMKQQARTTLRQNRLPAILGLLIPVAVVLVIYGVIFSLTAITESLIFSLLLIAAMIASIPINVGIVYFYRRLLHQETDPNYEDLLKGHQDGFLKNLGNLILVQIFVTLWMILFIIPGIIKTFSYMMVPYILGDDDIKKDAGSMDPITLSRVMMDGHKVEYFVLVLSFIGWLILGTLTLHILTIVFVLPYMQLTFAQFYEARKQELDSSYLVKS